MKGFRFPVLMIFVFMFLVMVLLNLYHSDSSYILEVVLFELSTMKFSFQMVIDSVSISFSLVVVLISFCVFLFSTFYMLEDKYYDRFIWILLLFVLSMNLLIYSGSVFMLLLGWDGLGLSSFALIIYYSSTESLKAGYMTLLINRIGDFLIIISMSFFSLVGYFSIAIISEEMMFVILIMIIASLTKSAQYPFSPWLPAAMAAPTPVSALVHSSTLVTAGVYLIIRLSLFHGLPADCIIILMILSSVTCLLGGWSAMYENDLKKIIALSTLSQLGIMMFSLSMSMSNMALFHLYTHAMFKALLFIVAGSVLMMSFGSQDVRLVSGLLKSSPILSVFLVISTLCLVSTPFLSSFYTKHMILELMINCGVVYIFPVVLMMFATAATVVYSFRLLKIITGSNILMSLHSIVGGSLLFYIPCVVLGIMSVISGKLFWMLNINFIQYIFIPVWINNIFNLILLMSIMISFYMLTGKSNYFLASMFFLVPSYSKSSSLLSSVIWSCYSLDYGWLEPKNLIKNSSFLSNSGGGVNGYWGYNGRKLVWWVLFSMLMFFNVSLFIM